MKYGLRNPVPIVVASAMDTPDALAEVGDRSVDCSLASKMLVAQSAGSRPSE